MGLCAHQSASEVVLRLQLADFGLSRVLETHATHVSTKTYGTLAYMPGVHPPPPLPVTSCAAKDHQGVGIMPHACCAINELSACGSFVCRAAELLQDGKMSRAADVYSFAMIMWELFACKRLYEGHIASQVRGGRLAMLCAFVHHNRRHAVLWQPWCRLNTGAVFRVLIRMNAVLTACALGCECYRGTSIFSAVRL